MGGSYVGRLFLRLCADIVVYFVFLGLWKSRLRLLPIFNANEATNTVRVYFLPILAVCVLKKIKK